MTAKEKAKELVVMMLLSHSLHFDDAKECALICVKDELELLKRIGIDHIQIKWEIQFLEYTKEEIEKLNQ
tara:strand:+ start:1445 stop:1654 length:210 start_codon:yes stop_codon:yes gene_type:complete